MLVQQSYKIGKPQRQDTAMLDDQLVSSSAKTRSIVENIPTLPLEKGTLINFLVIFALTFSGRIMIALIASAIL